MAAPLPRGDPAMAWWQGRSPIHMRAFALFVLIAALTAASFAIRAAGASAVTACSSGPFTASAPGEYCYSLPVGTTALRVVATGGGGGAGGARTNQDTAARVGNGGAGGAGAKVIAYLTNLSPS